MHPIMIKKMVSKVHHRLDIRSAIKRPGQLHRDLHVPQEQKIPVSMIRKAAKRPGVVGQRARFALTLRSFRKK